MSNKCIQNHSNYNIFTKKLLFKMTIFSQFYH